MNTHATKPGKIDRRLQGKPIQVDGRTVQPVARLFGFIGWGGGQNGSGGGAWLWLKPQEVVVRDNEEVVQRLALPDPTGNALRGLAAIGLAVAAVSCLMMILAWFLRSRHSAGE